MKPINSLVKICLLFIITLFYNADAHAAQLPENKDKTIKIGLLIPDPGSVAAKQGAELAIKGANKKGGLNGIPFELVTRYLDGPWGTGSKEAVNLIFEEKVWAILGSHDGRNAHIVEQAATKAHVVFLSAWTADPTLSQAFVPWFFNCVPNDRQQAESMVEEIYNIRGIKKIAVLSDNTYDSKLALKNFLDQIKITGKAEPVQFNYENSGAESETLTDMISKANAEGIVIFCEPFTSLKLIRQIRLNKLGLPVFGSLSISDENKLTGQNLHELDNFLFISSGNWPASKCSAFIREYVKLYTDRPGMVAAYAYDGMTLLIEAIKEAGDPEREKIQRSLETINYSGVTGSIQFDDKGNRMGTFKIKLLKNGIPVIL